MKLLICFVLASLTCAIEIYVKHGQDFQLTSHLPTHAAKKNFTYYWSKQRSWSKKFDQITKETNCNIKAYYNGRIKQCDQNLTIRAATNMDSGHYKIRYKYNKTVMEYQSFNVYVFDLQPVLAPTLIQRVKIFFWCGDLKNSLAESNIEIRPVKNQFNAQLRQAGKNYWYAIIDKLINDKYPMGTQYLFRTELRCCTKYKNIQACGPWTFVGHHMYLSTRRNKGRPWCSHKGEHSLDGVSFDYNHNGPLFEPTCFVTKFMPQNISICEGKKVTVYNVKRFLKRYRQFGGIRRLAEGNEYTFTPQLTDTGIYFDAQNVFNITVQPKLYVALRTVQIQDNFIELECVHTGNKEALITWYIEGQYASYKAVKNKILIYQDCWLDWDFWYYRFGVNCKVLDGTMEGYSRWLMGKVKRTNMLDNSVYG